MRCPNLVSVGFALTLVFLVQCASTPEDAAAPDATAEIAAAHAGHESAVRACALSCDGLGAVVACKRQLRWWDLVHLAPLAVRTVGASARTTHTARDVTPWIRVRCASSPSPPALPRFQSEDDADLVLAI